MSHTLGSTTSGTSSQQARTGPSNVDLIKPQEDKPSHQSKKFRYEEPGGILCQNAKQPSLLMLQLGVLKDRLQRMGLKQRSLLTVKSKMHVLVYSRSFDPILQKGPSCGMVALAMLARMLGKEEVTTEVIVDHARKRGYSRHGELFSVCNASALAEEVLRLKATVEEVSDDPWTVCQHLIDHAILFCYDNYGKHPSIHRRGRSAHWALITGFALVYEEDLTPKQQEVFDSYKTRGKGDMSERSALRQALFALGKHSKVPPTVYVLGREGNSEDTFNFEWIEMVGNSLQMMEFKESCFTADFVLPPEGMAAAMSGKFVKVHIPHEVAAFQVGSHVEEVDVLGRL